MTRETEVSRTRATFTRLTSARTIKQMINALLAILMFNLSVMGSIAQAQSDFDVIPPSITIDELSTGIAGETQIFTALVTDNNSILDVKLYYRFTGQGPFQSVVMSAIGDSSYYSASLPTQSDETRSIEYYLQARDNGGNRVVRGFAFEPLVRSLNAADAPVTQPPNSYPAGSAPTQQPQASSGGFKWWYLLLGALAVGAAAGLAGGGGSSEEPNVNMIPVNVTVSRPQ